MRCVICDTILGEPRYNAEIEGYEPCDTCLAVIEKTIAGYSDRAAVDEDELGQYWLPFDVEAPDPGAP